MTNGASAIPSMNSWGLITPAPRRFAPAALPMKCPFVRIMWDSFRKKLRTMPGTCHARVRTSRLLFPRPEREREACARCLVCGGKLQAIELTQDAALDSRVVEGRPRDARARNRAARADAERNTDAALQRGVVSGS